MRTILGLSPKYIHTPVYIASVWYAFSIGQIFLLDNFTYFAIKVKTNKSTNTTIVIVFPSLITTELRKQSFLAYEFFTPAEKMLLVSSFMKVFLQNFRNIIVFRFLMLTTRMICIFIQVLSGTTPTICTLKCFKPLLWFAIDLINIFTNFSVWVFFLMLGKLYHSWSGIRNS